VTWVPSKIYYKSEKKLWSEKKTKHTIIEISAARGSTACFPSLLTDCTCSRWVLLLLLLVLLPYSKTWTAEAEKKIWQLKLARE
jgi:hypothetical protein